jgi:hypothetical protein
MTDDTDIPTNVVELVDRDSQIFRLRLAGMSVRAIARQFRLTPAQVEAIVTGQCTPVTKQMKAHAFELELERLDELQSAFYAAAMAGNPQAAAITIKIYERRAAMLGYDAPSAIRLDPVQLVEAAKPQENSTDKIKAALDRIAAMYPKNGDGTDGEPPPSPPAA